MSDASPLPPPGPDRRARLLRGCMIVGFGGPALCWLAVLLGATRDVFPHDKVAVIAVLLSVYAPLLVFVNNPGERRSRYEQLVQFGWLWFFANTGYQLFWEMPWFLLRDTLMTGTITEADVWYWPWWAYGVADTRYLSHNDLSLTISAVDASVALLELATIFFFLRGYRIFTAWLALILSSCMGWGQYLFYLGEVYRRFENVQDGWFGMWFKFVILNFPWLVFPFIAGAGYIWFLARHYKRLGVREYLDQGPPRPVGDLAGECAFLTRTDEQAVALTGPANEVLMRRAICFFLLWPFVFLAVDIWRFYS